MRRTKGLVFVLALALMVFGLVAVANAATFSDVAADNAAYKDISKLSALSIVNGYPDGTFGPDKAVTRAEFAKIAVTMAGLKNSADYLANSSSQFTDVAAGQWYTGWVNVAASQGFLKGYPDGTFKPNANVTAAEAITICVRLLGYDDRLPGDWPVDYLAEASKLGITDDLSFVASAAANRGLIAQVSSATLDENIVSYDNDKEDFLEKTPVKSLLADGFKDSLLTEDVLVTAVKFDGDGYVMETYDPNPEDKDVDVVDTKEETTLTDDVTVAGAPSAFALEGRMVDYIVNDDGDITYVQLSDDIKAPVFGKIDAYDDSKKTVEIDDTDYDLNGDFFVSLGKVFDSGDITDLNDTSAQLGGASWASKLENFKVTLYFDDDNNVAFIYRTTPSAAMVVDEVKSDKITTKNNYTIKDLSEDDDYIIIKNGAPIALEDVKPGDVVYDVCSGDTIARGFDRYVVDVDSTVEGTFSRYYDDATSPEGTIGDTKYDFAVENGQKGIYLEDSEGDQVALNDISDLVGSDVVAKLDGNKEVTYVTGATTDAGSLYGVIVDAGVFNGKGSTDKWVELYTKGGDDVTYDISSDYWDADSDIAHIKDVIGDITNSTVFKGKLVKYSLDSNGEVDDIDNPSSKLGTNYTDGSKGSYVNVDDAEKDYDRLNVGGDWRYADDNTVVFDLAYDGTDVDPELATWTDVEDAGHSQVGNSSDVVKMDAYYDDDQLEYIVVWEQDGISDTDVDGVFVDSYKDGSDTYGQYYEGGELKEYKDSSADDRIAGAVYNYDVKTSDNKVNGVTEYNIGDDSFYYDTVTDVNSNNFVTDNNGTFKVNDDTMFIVMDGNDVDRVGDLSDLDEEDEVYILDGSDEDQGIAQVVVILDGTYPVGKVDNGGGDDDNGGGNEPGDTADVINATVATANFGSNVTVSVEVKGDADYPTAAKYQVFDGADAVSSVANLGSTTTVFPAVAAGGTVTVKLLAADGTTVLATKTVTLQ